MKNFFYGRGGKNGAENRRAGRRGPAARSRTAAGPAAARPLLAVLAAALPAVPPGTTGRRIYWRRDYNMGPAPPKHGCTLTSVGADQRQEKKGEAECSGELTRRS